MLENGKSSAVFPADQAGVPVRASNAPPAIVDAGVWGIVKLPGPMGADEVLRPPALLNGAVCLEDDSANTVLDVPSPCLPKAPVSAAAFLTRIRRYFAYSPHMPLRWRVMFPIFSINSAVSSIRVRTEGARAFVLVLLAPVAICVLSRRAKQAAKETIMAVLLGIEKSCFSPCTVARITFSAAERPAVRKKWRTSRGAVGWLSTRL